MLDSSELVVGVFGLAILSVGNALIVILDVKFGSIFETEDESTG
jgi:hypothetical protein